MGFVLGLVFAGLALAACYVVFRWVSGLPTDGAKWTDGDRKDRKFLIRFVRVAMPVLAAVVVLIAAVAFWPYRWEYHSYKTVSGTVEAIDARQISDGNGMSQVYVARIGGEPYRCDDTRCAAVHEGDALTLRCIKEWEYAGTDGYRCSFVAHEPRGQG